MPGHTMFRKYLPIFNKYNCNFSFQEKRKIINEVLEEYKDEAIITNLKAFIKREQRMASLNKSRENLDIKQVSNFFCTNSPPFFTRESFLNASNLIEKLYFDLLRREDGSGLQVKKIGEFDEIAKNKLSKKQKEQYEVFTINSCTLNIMRGFKKYPPELWSLSSKVSPELVENLENARNAINHKETNKPFINGKIYPFVLDLFAWYRKKKNKLEAETVLVIEISKRLKLVLGEKHTYGLEETLKMTRTKTPAAEGQNNNEKSSSPGQKLELERQLEEFRECVRYLRIFLINYEKSPESENNIEMLKNLLHCVSCSANLSPKQLKHYKVLLRRVISLASNNSEKSEEIVNKIKEIGDKFFMEHRYDHETGELSDAPGFIDIQNKSTAKKNSERINPDKTPCGLDKESDYEVLKLKKFNTVLEEIVEDRMLGPQETERRKEVTNTISRLIVKILKNTVEIKVFGSFACDLATKTSDVDLAVKSRIRIKSKANFLTHLNSRLEKHGLPCELILTARHPLIKTNLDGIDFDVTIFKNENIFKTQMLANYCSIDDRVGKFIIGVKTWARSRKMNKALDKMINSFGWSLLSLSFLQNVVPPVIPLGKTKSTAKFSSQNIMSLGDLFYLFLKRYSSHSINYRKEAISVVNGKVIRRIQDRSPMYVEDPYMSTVNVSRHLNKKNFRRILAEMRRALVLVEKGEEKKIKEIFSGKFD